MPAVKRLPRIAITMGDAAGIGPEVCLKLLQQAEVGQCCVPILFGDAAALHRDAQSLGLSLPTQVLSLSQLTSASELDQPTLIDFATPGMMSVKPGELSAIAGDASFQYVDQAIDWHLSGVVDAMVTGPINKTAVRSAGHDFSGHTEFVAAKTDTTRFCMMQYSPSLTCSFVTTHVGYRDVPQLLSVQRILDVIRLTDQALRRIEGRDPRLVVCGLNPHAGEHGLFGNREEERIIVPAIQSARADGIDVTDPLPPDTCFIPSRRASTDGFICMYHDQGHIPLKAIAFDQAVNVTLGLPIIRTSVDHGTAFDIVGRNCADPSSLAAAVSLAIQLVGSKPEPLDIAAGRPANAG